MDTGARQATVHGVARVGHNLATKPPPPPQISSYDSAGLSVLQARSSISNTLSGYSKSIPVHISFNIFFLSSYKKTNSTSNRLKKLRSHTTHLIGPLFLKLSIDFKYLKPQALTS